jgi:predicted RNase H-like HicB family nuclease
MEYHLSTVVSKGEKFFVARGIEIELASQGKTVEDAIRNLKEAFQLWLKHAEPEELELLNRADPPMVTQVEVAA